MNLGLIPSSDAGWLTGCAALRADAGGILHVHATVTSSQSQSGMTMSSSQSQSGVAMSSFVPDSRAANVDSVVASDNCSGSSTALSDKSVSDNIDYIDTAAAKMRMTKFAKTCATKAAWRDWADSVCQRLQRHLNDMLRCDWSVSVLHIEHVKSYAPNIDHVVADVECRPPC